MTQHDVGMVCSLNKLTGRFLQPRNYGMMLKLYAQQVFNMFLDVKKFIIKSKTSVKVPLGFDAVHQLRKSLGKAAGPL